MSAPVVIVELKLEIPIDVMMEILDIFQGWVILSAKIKPGMSDVRPYDMSHVPMGYIEPDPTGEINW